MIRLADPAAGDEGLSAESWRVIRRTARRLTRRAEFNRSDRDDIEQELALAVWAGLDRFDPAVAAEGALVNTIVRRAGASLIRRRAAQRRDGRRDVGLPLDDPRDELGACLAHDDGHERAVDTAHDVTTLVARLPADLRAIADELKRASVREAAQNLQISRATIYRKIAELRAHFSGELIGNCRDP